MRLILSIAFGVAGFWIGWGISEARGHAGTADAAIENLLVERALLVDRDRDEPARGQRLLEGAEAATRAGHFDEAHRFLDRNGVDLGGWMHRTDRIQEIDDEIRIRQARR